MKKWILPAAIAVTATLSLSACDNPANDRYITILATNDIHGGIEPAPGPKANNKLGALNIRGGMAIFSGVAKAIKQGLQNKYGAHAGALVLDAGDQFQGTLISNYTEGSLIFSAMNDTGYDAAITGNHDYDFGPHGWLVDAVKDVDPNDPAADRDPRGVLKDLASKASFPIVSANTYYKSSLLDKKGNSVDVSGEGCAPLVSGTVIDWSRAKRPEFLKPYMIKIIAGVRVAVIGIDNPETPTTTTPSNVSDLCFRDEFEAYKEVREQLEGQADVFVLLIHDGNSDNAFHGTDIAEKLYDYSSNAVNAVIAGHTHYINNVNVHGIPVIQSGHGGQLFGRVDLVYNIAAHSTQLKSTIAGAALDYAACEPSIQSFCSVLPDKSGVAYEGVPVVPDATITAKITDARKVIEPMAKRILGYASGDLTVDRINESPLADALADTFRDISKTEIAIINTGGLRTDLKPGPVTYENLFQVIPFNNHGYVIGPMPVEKLIALFEKSVQSCGAEGALMESGLKITYSRTCGSQPEDKNAKLLHVETLSGEVILDIAHGIQPSSTRVFDVATLDFLAEGGSGYSDFIGTPRINDLGIIREVLANSLAKNPAQWSATTDGRLSLTPVAAPTPTP